MFFRSYPLKYDEPLFRPPAEAESLIFQVTLGCSWNRCSFCEMYTTKHFRVRDPQTVLHEIDDTARRLPETRKIFLADGNPMVLGTDKLLPVLEHIRLSFPRLRRISTYALPSDIRSKTPEQLRMLKQAGLSLLYVGIESGDDEVLKMNHKSETAASTLEGLLMAKEAGFKLSLMVLNGLGGMKYSEQHALNSAALVNAICPELLSTLVLSFPFGVKHFQKRFSGDFIPMQVTDLLREMKTFIEATRLRDCIFRSDHASNYLVLNGILDRDREMFCRELDFAVENPRQAGLRPEWRRGL